MPGRTILFLKGADRVRYLNGQVTSNVSALHTNHTQPACVTTAKGRLCAEIMIAALADSLVVDADAALRESLPPRLERYIVADDVELHDASDEWRLLHFLPPQHHEASTAPPSKIASLYPRAARRFGRDGFDILAPVADAAGTIASLAEAYVVIEESMAETLRIEAGTPRWGHELGEDTLPPEAGLDRTHIDYHKGCYIGQEVISRLKSVGHVNRHLAGLISDTDAPLAAGMSVFHEASAAQIGALTSAAYSFALERSIALGYLKRGSSADGLIARSAESNGAEIRVAVRPLPFAS